VASSDERLAEPGVPVDALCIGCKQDGRDRQKVKHVTLEELDADSADELETATFEDVCHHCQGVEYWNVVRVLHGLIDSDGGEDGE